MTETARPPRGPASEADARDLGRRSSSSRSRAIALLLPSAITTDATVTNDPESEQGYAAIFRHLPPSDDFVNEVVLARAPGKDVTTDRDSQLEIERLASALAGDRPDGAGPLLLRRRGSGLLSPDRDAARDHDRDGAGRARTGSRT